MLVLWVVVSSSGNFQEQNFLKGVVVKSNLLVWCLYDWFAFGLTQLTFTGFGSIGLALSGPLCIVVNLGIGPIHC